MTEYDPKELLTRAQNAAHNAYAPYSNEPKGAALVCADGSIYTCGSLEFVTYGGSVCAELGALTKAVSESKRQFKTLALTPYRYPCGSCRQFFSEFGLDLDVLTAHQDGTIERKSLSDLLPNSFGKSNLA